MARLAAGAVVRDTLGRPVRDLRISVMDRCNFRCPYCMPKEQFHDNYRFMRSAERLTFEEIVRVARVGACRARRRETGQDVAHQAHER
jgi:cyclic pyranopterin phosphate synthase